MTKNDKDNEMTISKKNRRIAESWRGRRITKTKNQKGTKYVLGKSSSLAALACALCINAFASDGTVLKNPIRGGSSDG
jgi:hypothetical protein